MYAETHHIVHALGLDKMTLTDFNGGQAHAVAERVGNGWRVYGPPGVERSAKGRNDAIDALIDVALETLPEDGYSTWVPHVHIGDLAICLRELP